MKKLFDNSWKSISNASEILNYISEKMVASYTCERFDYETEMGVSESDLTFTVKTLSIENGINTKKISVNGLCAWNADSLIEVVNNYLK